MICGHQPAAESGGLWRISDSKAENLVERFRAGIENGEFDIGRYLAFAFLGNRTDLHSMPSCDPARLLFHIQAC